jgi:integrase
MWLTKERKYARFSLKTTNRSTAVDKAKLHYHELMAGQLAGKTYYSITAMKGVEMYLEHRLSHVTAGVIVKGRYSTIATHLEHWLDFIGRDTKLKEMERTDCESYYASRTKTKKATAVSNTTIANEQSTINAMMKWLFKKNETYIDSFDFIKLKRSDKGLDENRRSTFTEVEFKKINEELTKYIKEAEEDLGNKANLTQATVGYYLGVAAITGLRRGEQLQLRWCDVMDIERKEARNNKFDLIQITVRGETSKIRKTRKFVIKDSGYFYGLLKLQMRRLGLG